VTAPAAGDRGRSDPQRSVVVLLALVAAALATVAGAGDKLGEVLPATNDTATLTLPVEALLTRHHIRFELRETTEKHIKYSAQVPEGKRTDRVSEAIAALHGAEAVAVAWEEKRAAK
jgi:hypothetical protein